MYVCVCVKAVVHRNPCTQIISLVHKTEVNSFPKGPKKKASKFKNERTSAPPAKPAHTEGRRTDGIKQAKVRRRTCMFKQVFRLDGAGPSLAELSLNGSPGNGKYYRQSCNCCRCKIIEMTRKCKVFKADIAVATQLKPARELPC